MSLPLYYGFILGFLVPLLSARLAKVVPADAGTALALALSKGWWRFSRSRNPELCRKRLEMWFRRILWCLLWGAGGAGFTFLFCLISGVRFSPAIPLFFCFLGVAASVDQRTQYLPDVFTVPLLILGFSAACYPPLSGVFGLSPLESAAGALFGYALPTVAAALMYHFKPDAMGGGDVKMLAALGAWLGIPILAAAVLFSCLIFTAVAVVKGRRAGPYGPSLVFGAFAALLLKPWLLPLFMP